MPTIAWLLLIALAILLFGLFTTLKWLIIVAIILAVVAVIRAAMDRSGPGGY